MGVSQHMLTSLFVPVAATEILTWGDGTTPYTDVLDNHLGGSFSSADPPPSLVQSCDISPDGMMIAYGMTDRVYAYRLSGTVLTRVLADTGYTGVGPVAVCFSPDSTKLMVSTGVTGAGSSLKTFETSGWTTITSPSVSQLVRNIDWSTNYLALALDVSPYVRLFDATSYVENGSFTASLANAARSARIRPDESRIAVITTDMILTLYNTSTWAKVTAAATQPSGAIPATPNVMEWSPDGLMLVLGSGASPFMWAYSVGSGAPVKLTNPATLPANTGRAFAFSKDGANLFVGFQNTASPRLYRYSISGTTLTKQTDPSTQPNANPFCMATDIITVL